MFYNIFDECVNIELDIIGVKRKANTIESTKTNIHLVLNTTNSVDGVNVIFQRSKAKG